MRFFPCVFPCGSEKFRPRTEKYLAWGVFGDPGRSRRRTPACTAPIGVGDTAAPLADVDNLKAALAGVNAAGAFLSAASPGVISLFFRNDHYASQEAYLFAIAEAMRGEYEAIAAAGVIVQIDCPDLAMGRHIQYADLSVEWPGINQVVLMPGRANSFSRRLAPCSEPRFVPSFPPARMAAVALGNVLLGCLGLALCGGAARLNHNRRERHG